MIAFIVSFFIDLELPAAQVEPCEAEIDALWAPEGSKVIIAIPADPDERGFEVADG